MGVLASESSVPQAFAHRIKAFALAAGHIAVMDAGVGLRKAPLAHELFVELESIRTTRFGEENQFLHDIPLVKRDRSSLTWCKSDQASAALLRIWSNKNASDDVVVAGSISELELTKRALLSRTSDPFVLGNLGKFLGRRGRSLVEGLFAESPGDVVAVVVGPPTEIYFFAEPETLGRLVDRVFECSSFSKDYLLYSRSSFVSIDQALKQIKPILRSSASNERDPGTTKDPE